jgi:hypothetical protein
MRNLSLLLLIAALGTTACDGGSETKPADGTAEAGKEPANTTPPPKTDPIALADLQASAQNITLVPSPVEMQRALDKAGIAQGLDKLVVERKLKMDIDNKDVIAVRTGVVLADTLLTVKDSPKEKLVERLGIVKTGLTALGAGEDLPKTVDDLIARITNDAVSRDDLIKELDELHGAAIPEIKYEAGERCVPLLQAGSWLEGSNLVATAIVGANNATAGTQLLRQPQVADYFLKYVKVEGEGKAPDEVLKQLETTLLKLKEIAGKTELTLDDVKEVKSQTDAVLALL